MLDWEPTACTSLQKCSAEGGSPLQDEACGRAAGLAQASEAAAQARCRSASAGVRRCSSSRAPRRQAVQHRLQPAPSDSRMSSLELA